MATEKRLIDANALMNVLKENHDNVMQDPEVKSSVKWREAVVFHSVSQAIRHAPNVDAVEVVHGEWSTNEDDYLGLIALQCSKCNQEYWFEDEPPMKIYNYCPHCGAKMDGGS